MRISNILTSQLKVIIKGPRLVENYVQLPLHCLPQKPPLLQSNKKVILNRGKILTHNEFNSTNNNEIHTFSTNLYIFLLNIPLYTYIIFM